uniref:Uncharacterized protein n=1 Tax=Triticum urartu TaxID=4572 RepID=A0A8R7TBR9_TRIUA
MVVRHMITPSVYFSKDQVGGEVPADDTLMEVNSMIILQLLQQPRVVLLIQCPFTPSSPEQAHCVHIFCCDTRCTLLDLLRDIDGPQVPPVPPLTKAQYLGQIAEVLTRRIRLSGTRP